MDVADVMADLRLELDSQAQACWDFAGQIGDDSSSDSRVSYTSLLLALLFAGNDVSRWLSAYLRSAGADVAAIERVIGVGPGGVAAMTSGREEAPPPTAKNEVTLSAREILANAETAAAAVGARQIGVRHVVAGYLYPPPSGWHADEFAAWKIDARRAATEFQKFIRPRHLDEAAGWLEIHSRHYDNAAEIESHAARLAGFAADTPEGDDLLGIHDDVYAFAALICSTKVAPPLSIGLFGEWGGGKSFFLRRLQQGVKWIAEDTRQKARLQKDSPFYKNVVQIEFNAWNYSGGNLWAALVQHILENLRLTPHGEDDDLVAARRAYLQKEMQLETDARRAARTRKVMAQLDARALRRKANRLREDHAAHVKKLQDAVNADVWRTVAVDAGVHDELNRLRSELGLDETVQNTAGDVIASIDAVQSLLARTSALLRAVPAGQRGAFVGRSAVVLLAPVVVASAGGLGAAWLLESELGASVTALLTWLTTAAGCGAAWVRARSKAVGDALARLERLRAHAQLRVEEARQKHKADIARLEKDIALARDEIVAAESKRREAQLRLQRLEAELAATTTARVLEDFVRERADSDDYRRHLGLPAVIRRDFDRISKMIAAENEALNDVLSLEEESRDSERRINRIVLYIDDLDRCPEELVVEVLSAVHLLLAFPLFVVVVAVDVRWVSQSLAKRYPGLLGGTFGGRGGMNAAASPTDYLEKIFQVPFWIRPPGQESVVKMMRNLLGGAVRKPQAAAAPASGASDRQTQPIVLNPGGFAEGKHDPEGRSLEIEAAELEFIESLAPLLSRSPRALKRFVNVYRLFKSSLAAGADLYFMSDARPDGAPHEYKVVLLLLAIENGLPRVADVLMRRLIDRNDPLPDDLELGALVQELGGRDGRTKRQADTLQAWLSRNAEWERRRLHAFSEWAPRVAQFSYRSYA